ncbi:hypothetical protein [Plesiomonas shigelloides]|uniref:hypothetical protein n=1 Tax=Plesiomonas shigelloides TaxID=703 RepID=UPI0015A6F025|nr:hypothetical protein [Plesiomonas shigelloides]
MLNFMKKIICLLLLLSGSAQAINVDKMLVVAAGDNLKKSQIVVVNSDDTPVLVSAELTEMRKDGKEVKFDDQDFKNWPVYLDNSEWIIDPKSRMKVTVNNLLVALKTEIKEDRVIGISFIPQSYQDDGGKKSALSVLTGFKVWYIIPNNKEKVTGAVDVLQVKNKITLVNKTDTAIQYYIDSCKAPVLNQPECSDSVLVLSGRQKDVTFDSSFSGAVSISAEDFNHRYKKEFNIKF